MMYVMDIVTVNSVKMKGMIQQIAPALHITSSVMIVCVCGRTMHQSTAMGSSNVMMVSDIQSCKAFD